MISREAITKLLEIADDPDYSMKTRELYAQMAQAAALTRISDILYKMLPPGQRRPPQ